MDGGLVWATTMGFSPGSHVGYASPIVVDGYQEANTAMMAATHGLVILGEGQACPTDDPIFECSGHGDCDCTTGTCSCDPGNLCFTGPDCTSPCRHGTCDPSVGGCECDACWLGSTCSVPRACGVNSACDITQNACACNACFSKDALGFCTVPHTCSGHGTCGAGGCTCDPGYSGSDCSVAPDNGASAGGVAAGVLLGVPATLMVVGAAYLAYFRYANPLKPLHAALPPDVQRRLGFAVYSSFSAPPSATGGGGAGSSSSSGGAFGGGGGGGGGGSSPAGKLFARVTSSLSGSGSGAGGSPKVPGGLMVKGNTEDALARTRLLGASATPGKAAASAAAPKAGGYGTT
jgi:hypothetical protein